MCLGKYPKKYSQVKDEEESEMKGPVGCTFFND